MLVLTRKLNQSIVINDEITITVLSIRGEKVRLGIEAPRDVPVFRKEIYLRRLADGAHAAGDDAGAAAAGQQAVR